MKTIETTDAKIQKDSTIESKIITIIGVLILLVTCSSISFIGGRATDIGKGMTSIFDKSTVGSSNPDGSVNTDLFWTVWNTMKSNYVDSSKSDSKEMMYGAIKGMVASYDDPATLFFTPEETQKFNDQNSGKFFEGIGAELGYRDGVIVIVAPIDGSPAQKIGLLPGDVILKVDDTDVKTTDSIYDVVDKIRGKSGTTVKITIFRKGDSASKDFEIVRGAITLPAITIKKPSDLDKSLTEYDGKVAVLNVSRFTASNISTWERDWDDAVKQINGKGYSAVVLDLRNNPGGFFDAAIYAAEEFLPLGTVVSKQQDKNGNIEEFKVERQGKLLNTKLVILVNDGSASASEILSGALKQSNRAKVYGTNTFGKGTAQNVIDLSDGSTLHITIMKWLLPNGEWLNHDNPIKPDVEIQKTDEDFKNGFDPQLNGALKFIVDAK